MWDDFSNLKDPGQTLKDLSEHGVCLITGATENLIFMPVDLRVENVLPDNICQISEEISKETQPIYNYLVKIKDFTITFSSGAPFENYNRLICEALELSNDLAELKAAPQGLFDLWLLLLRRHAKGISKITCGVYSVDKKNMLQSLMAHVYRQKKMSQIHLVR